MPSKEFEDRILNKLLPEFCNDPARGYDMTGFRAKFHEIDDTDAENFLKGLDAGLVTPVGNMYRAPKSRAREQFFYEHEKSSKPRLITLWVKPVITVATLSKLHFDLGWPKELLGTQSADWAFDVTAYIELDDENEYISCEVKKTLREMDHLVTVMRKFATLPPSADVSNREKNAYQKIKGLRARQAPLFWAVGPGSSSIVFKLTYLDDGLIAFEEASIHDLRYPALSSF